MKKFLAFALALVMALSLMGTALASDLAGTYDIKIWVAEKAVDLTKQQIEDYNKSNELGIVFNATVEPVSEADAATNMITDVEAGGDIYCFAQDQFARLVQAGALAKLGKKAAETVTANNDAGTVAAATSGDTLYAYPLTSDNGYFMYYDKSVVTDPSDLAKVLADCEAAGKNFYFEVNSGWYQTAFFFGYGCQLTFDTDDQGALTKMNASYATENGVKALKAMIQLVKSPAFVNGSSLSSATNVGAIVDGTWDADSAKAAFGDNYAAAKLPAVDGVQLGGFGGFKMLGVKPQTDDAKLAACDALAAWLTSGEVQLARFNAIGWGPSNLEAQQNEAVQADVALSALAAQLAFTQPQGQYPGEYWSLATGLGDDIIAGKLDGLDDAALLDVLKGFEATCEGYLSK